MHVTASRSCKQYWHWHTSMGSSATYVSTLVLLSAHPLRAADNREGHRFKMSQNTIKLSTPYFMLGKRSCQGRSLIRLAIQSGKLPLANYVDKATDSRALAEDQRPQNKGFANVYNSNIRAETEDKNVWNGRGTSRNTRKLWIHILPGHN